MKKKVFVAISGGVDSSVSAALLQEKGYDIELVYMKNWEDVNDSLKGDCPWEEDLTFVSDVAEKLNVKYRVYNFVQEYSTLVMDNFFEEYQKGNTPNPDILCNKYIKFDTFLKRAIEEGADLIATGHYAQTKGGKLYKGADPKKDQSYFLAGLKEKQLKKTLFPIGHLEKKTVRKLAAKYNFRSAERKDSQGICFVGKIKLRDFLAEKLKPKKGYIIDIDTKETVGEHEGIWFYTNGQREGLKIGGLQEPYFVHSKDVDNNILFVANGKNNPKLWESHLTVKDPSMIDPNENIFDIPDLTAIIRYRGASSPVKVTDDRNDQITIDFEEKQWAPASGQSVVFYHGDRCIGLAKIA